MKMALLVRLVLFAAMASVLACADDSRDRLEELSRRSAPCESADDCCVVYDGCYGRGYVVGVGSYDEAKKLAKDSDKSECRVCMTPLVALECVEGQCLGRDMREQRAKGVPGLEGLSGNHCGGMETNGDSSSPAVLDSQGESTGRVLGCGL